MTDLDHPAPAFSQDDAAFLAAKHFGLTGELTRLDSERDQNFRLVSDGTAWTFKIINASEPALESDFQVALLDHLSAVVPGLPLPRLRKSTSGSALATAEGQSGVSHSLRTVSWLAGQPLAESARTPAQLRSFGQMLGRMDRALQGFIHPGALRVLDWDVRRTGEARKRLGHIADASDRALLIRFLDRFDAEVAPSLPTLRTQVIHNDANDWNVLIDPERPDRIAGVIDFGDALHTVLIAEVAVAAAYAILDQKDPIGAAAEMLAGFHEQYKLQEEEVDLLFDLIADRLVISVTLSAARRERTGENPYLAISEAPAWRLLRRLDAMNPRFATAILRHACGFDAAAAASAVSSWIAHNARSFAPVVRPHPATQVKALVPLGEPSHPMTVASAAAEPERASDWWDAHAAQNGITLGMGPWGEKRAVYTGDMFSSRLIEGERRTRHLGLDLFMPAGTRLHTPLAAIVKSVEIENERLGYGGLVALLHEPQGCPPFVTLWGHLAHEVVRRLEPGQKLEAGALVGEMGAAAENGGWSPHLHLQISTDTRIAASEMIGVGEEKYLGVWASLFPDASMLAGIPPETFVQAGRSRDEIVAARRTSMLPNLSISYSEPIKFVRGEGVWLIDDRGRAYLDCFNNVCHVGHAHPHVVEAIARQAAKLNTNTRYLHDNIVTYAERLTATLPAELSVASFACSGSEANSLMMRMARAHTGREDVIVLDWAYHGTTQEMIDISPYKYKRKGGKGRKPHVFEAVIPDSYRAPEDWPAEDHARRFAESVAELIEAMRRQGRAPALFVAESIPSVAGQVFLPKGYLSKVYAMVRAAGGLCVADEVQVGFGRVGSHWWAFETQGVSPDIVTMGKPIGNGHPMAALVTTREVAASFNNGMEYFNTFGGNPVSCAAGLAVLDVIEQGDLRRNASEIGDYLLSRFRDMQKRHEAIGDVRGMGLFLGIELVEDRRTKKPATALAKKISDGVRRRGALIGTEGPHDNVLKMRPPMIFTRADADHLIAILEDTFEAAISGKE